MWLCGRASVHSVMGHWVNPSWCTNLSMFTSSQCSTTGVTSVVGMVDIKNHLLLIVKSSPVSGRSRFLF